MRASDYQAVGVATQEATDGQERQRLGWGKVEAGFPEQLPRALLEIMPAVENLAQPRRMRRRAPPVVLHLAQALAADDAGTEIRARQLGRQHGGALDRTVDRDVDRG